MAIFSQLLLVPLIYISSPDCTPDLLITQCYVILLFACLTLNVRMWFRFKDSENKNPDEQSQTLMINMFHSVMPT